MLNERDYFRRNDNGYRPQGYWARHSIIFHIIIVNVVLFFLSSEAMEESFALLSGQGLRQPWRLVTYQFLHAGFAHIFFNMYGLWIFGRMVEEVLGRTRFLMMYLFSGVLGGLFFLIANANAFAACVGASGAVFGVMVAAAMVNPNARFLLLIPPIPVRLWVLVAVYCGIEVFQALMNSRGNIAHMAHLGGALGGFLFMHRLARANGCPQWLRNLFTATTKRPRPTPSSGTGYRPPSSTPPADDGPYTINQEELNRLLDKIARQGYEQLTETEKETLRRSSEELKRRRGL